MGTSLRPHPTCLGSLFFKSLSGCQPAGEVSGITGESGIRWENFLKCQHFSFKSFSRICCIETSFVPFLLKNKMWFGNALIITLPFRNRRGRLFRAVWQLVCADAKKRKPSFLISIFFVYHTRKLCSFSKFTGLHANLWAQRVRAYPFQILQWITTVIGEVEIRGKRCGQKTFSLKLCYFPAYSTFKLISQWTNTSI